MVALVGKQRAKCAIHRQVCGEMVLFWSLRGGPATETEGMLRLGYTKLGTARNNNGARLDRR